MPRPPLDHRFARRALARTLLLATASSVVTPPARGQEIAVRYTSHGVPHVTSSSLAGVAEGYGWAFARDNLCLLVEKAVTLAGERSRWLGPDSGYVDLFVGGFIRNAASDAAYRYLLGSAAREGVRRAASPDVRALVRGYVQGVNRHLAADALPGESCREARWFRPLTEADVWRRMAQMPLIETSILLLREIAGAQPPAPGDERGPLPPTLDRAQERAAAAGGSNAFAAGSAVLGRRRGGFTFANPHFPWHGTERLYVAHLTVPGSLDIFGASLYGVPVPLIGFTRAIGWSDTHTTDKRSTIYELTLDPTDPTRYRIGDTWEAMRAVTVSVPTSATDTLRHTIWETRYGPMLVGQSLPWTSTRAYAFADPERGNVRMADTFLAIARARSVAGIRDALQRHHGSPWSNVTAADSAGGVFYGNISVAAYITDAQWARCAVSTPARAFQDLADVTVLSGSDPSCAWTRDPRAPQPGIIPATLRPWTIRRDVVFNSNDSHWLSTPDSAGRLEGYLGVIGPERTVRGERTRVAALYSQHFMAGTNALTPRAWETLFFSSRNLLAELVLDDVVADCRANPVVAMADGSSVDLGSACSVLERWDRTDRLESRGSALFADFMRGLQRVPMTGFALAARYWKVPFDVGDPVGTPRGFVPSLETRRALAAAAARFAAARVAMDAPLGEVQAVVRRDERLPMSGASFTYHMASPAGLVPGRGITDLRLGDSYIHAVTLAPSGPVGRFLVTYSQSTNPASPHFADMTATFSRQGWLDVAFSRDEVTRAQVGPTHRWRSGAAR